jgi:hypothetical protein
MKERAVQKSGQPFLLVLVLVADARTFYKSRIRRNTRGSKKKADQSDFQLIH